MSILEGKANEALDRISAVRLHVFYFRTITKGTVQAYVPTLIRNWSVLSRILLLTTPKPSFFCCLRGVFIPTQIINFGLVPHHLRFVVVSVVSLFWSTFCHSRLLDF